MAPRTNSELNFPLSKVCFTESHAALFLRNIKFYYRIDLVRDAHFCSPDQVGDKNGKEN